MFILTNKGRFSIFSFLTILFAVSAMQAQSFPGSGFTVVDGGNRTAASCSTVNVTGLTTDVVVSSISFNGFTHSWLGDLELRVYRPADAAPPSATGSVVLASPPDGRSCNFNGNYRFTDNAAQSIDAATVGCASATNLPSGDYRTSTYGGGTSNGPVTSLTTSIGSLTAAQANGAWRVCAFDFGTPDGGAVASTAINFTVFTAASATINGRVNSVEGRGIVGANVILTDSNGNSKTAVTNSFGMYNFDEVEVGGTYTVTVIHKRYQFQNPTQVINVSENVSGLNFIATE